MIWAGDDKTSFHTSHRTIITGSNTGYSNFAKPTGKSVRLFCIANCVAKNNEIYYENVVYDTAGLIKQLGLDLNEVAKQIANKGNIGPFAPDFRNSKPKRNIKKLKPISFAIPDKIKNIREFVHAVFDTIWNRRNFSVIDQVYSDEESWTSDECTKKELSDFVESLNSGQFKLVENFFLTMPKLSHKIKVTNPNTKVESDVTIEGLQSFFG